MANFKKFEKHYGEIKRDLVESKVEGICLDIDDTITTANLFFAEKFHTIFCNPEGSSPQELIAKYRYVRNVQHWQDSHKQQMIEECFSSGSYIHLYPPMPEARECVLEIDKTIPIISYLTGRPNRFYQPTSAWIERHGFPKKRIIMQPEQNVLEELCISDGDEWKAKLLEFLFPEVIGSIDDNLDVVRNLSRNYKGLIFLYSHSAGSIDHSNVVCCPDWEKTKSEINKRFKKRRNQND